MLRCAVKLEQAVEQIVEPERNQRACHSQDSNACLVGRRQVDSTVGRRLSVILHCNLYERI